MSEIHDASGRGDLAKVCDLLESDPGLANADDEHEWRPLFHAGLWKRTDVVRTLLDFGADVSAHDGYALHFSGEVPNNKEIVELLIQAGALEAYTRPPTDLMREFLHAVFLAQEKRVAAFLNREPALATTESGRSMLAIHYASQHGDTRIVELLLDAGADVNATNRDGQTVLYCAAGHGHAETVQVLLARGADREAKLSDGKTILEWLAQFPGDSRFTKVSRIIAAG